MHVKGGIRRASFSSSRAQLEQQMSVTSGYGFPSHFTSHSPSQRRTHDYRASRKARVHVYVHALDAACLDIDQGAMCSGFFFWRSTWVKLWELHRNIPSPI